jgi:hypothetical protein
MLNAMIGRRLIKKNFSQASSLACFKMRYRTKEGFTEFIVPFPSSFETKKLILKNENCTISNLKNIFKESFEKNKTVTVTESQNASKELPDDTNLAEYLRQEDTQPSIYFDIDNKFRFILGNEWKVLNLLHDGTFKNPEIENIVKDSQCSNYVEVYTRLWEKLKRLEEVTESKCPVDKLEQYLLNDNSHELLKEKVLEELSPSSEIFDGFSIIEGDKKHNLNYQLKIKKMILEEKLNQLQSDKHKIMHSIEQKVHFYQRLFLVGHAVQWTFFYYCIFHVEWLGWDIMEPITYSLEVIKFLFALRFFNKYKKDKNFTNMQSIFEERFKVQNPLLGKQLDDIDLKIEDINKQLSIMAEYQFLQE